MMQLNGPLRVGIGGPVGSGKTALMEALCKTFRDRYDLCAITNDIYTKEDARLLTVAGALPVERIMGVETGGCPHTAIREDASINLAAIADMRRKFPKLDLILIESGGDNLAATFSPELADLTIYVIDVAGGEKIPRKGGPGITRSDLLVVNKIDLAPFVGADLAVMEADTQADARRAALRLHQYPRRRRGRRRRRLHRTGRRSRRGRLTSEDLFMTDRGEFLAHSSSLPGLTRPSSLSRRRNWMAGSLPGHEGRIAVAAAILTLLATPAFAHTGLGDAHGFLHGFVHPIGGLDHVLAMVGVGLFAATLGGRALWAVPASFVAMMLVGGALGAGGVDLPGVEIGIAASIIVIGFVVALGRDWPLFLAMGLVGAFAVFHGHAHGAEMPLESSALAYSAGFALATALLHVAGLALGLAARDARLALRAGGVLTALAGLWLGDRVTAARALTGVQLDWALPNLGSP